YLFFSRVPRAMYCSLFPYTTLFRSGLEVLGPLRVLEADPHADDVHVLLEQLGELAIALGRLCGHAQHQRRAIRHVAPAVAVAVRSEEHTSELQSLAYLVCRPLLEKK